MDDEATRQRNMAVLLLRGLILLVVFLAISFTIALAYSPPLIVAAPVGLVLGILWDRLTFGTWLYGWEDDE